MKLKTNSLAKATKARRMKRAAGFELPSIGNHIRNALLHDAVDLTHPDMERRMRAQRIWEYLDESKSKFYARMNETEASYDPLFPQPIPSSSTGKGHKRWKLGAIIAWMRHCEAVANNSYKGEGHED